MDLRRNRSYFVPESPTRNFEKSGGATLFSLCGVPLGVWC